jgi:quinol monooxygenase YgiN
MKLGRREFVTAMVGAAAYALSTFAPGVYGETKMYGLIGKMLAVEGKRDELIAILLKGTEKMPGCLSYVIAKDLKDGNAIWITEVWDSKESHAASLEIPAVQTAISNGRVMIAGFGERFETEPVGGHGIARGMSW